MNISYVIFLAIFVASNTKNDKVMGKITVKHYLNTNLKPYIVRGESYYSIYIMIVVNRKNTKVKSITFEELYTEKDFEEILNEDNDLLRQEIIAIENLCLLIQDTIGIFDTSFFSAYYTSMHDLFVDTIDYELANINFWNKERNKLGLSISDFVFGDFSFSINKTHGMDMFTWFSEMGQKELYKYLKSQNIPDGIELCTNMLNKFTFLGSLNSFGNKLKGSKKGMELYDKFSVVIQDGQWQYSYELKDKYGL